MNVVARRLARLTKPMRVTSMIANRFVQGPFVLVFSAETTRARVTGHFSRA